MPDKTPITMNEPELLPLQLIKEDFENMLKRIGIDILKTKQSIAQSLKKPSDAEIAAALIGLTAKVGLMIADGKATKEEWEEFIEWAINTAGNLYGVDWVLKKKHPPIVAYLKPVNN